MTGGPSLTFAAQQYHETMLALRTKHMHKTNELPTKPPQFPSDVYRKWEQENVEWATFTDSLLWGIAKAKQDFKILYGGE